jgi:FkbM family methyltransferase
MKNRIKKLIKNIIHSIGLELSYYVPLANALNVNGIKTVFDIGANKGQFAESLRRGGFKGKIISFEPTTEAYKIIINRSRNDDNWIIHERCALGSVEDVVEINISKNSGSSSILPILSAHLNSAPDSKYIGKEKINQIPFDKIFKDYWNGLDPFFLKIDTQGYENEIIKGAENALRYAKGVQLEISFHELYANQANYKDILRWAELNNFFIWSFHDGFSNIDNGKTLQADICFFKNDKF